jgi:hypothetical protein
MASRRDRVQPRGTRNGPGELLSKKLVSLSVKLSYVCSIEHAAAARNSVKGSTPFILLKIHTVDS